MLLHIRSDCAARTHTHTHIHILSHCETDHKLQFKISQTYRFE